MTSDDSPHRRRFLDAKAGSPTLLGDGGRLEGRVTIPGPLAVSGTIIADGEIGGVLTIGRTGSWHGNVRAHAAVVLGELRGTLEVATTLELGRTAVVHGSVCAALVAIADGAVVDGDIRVTGETPVVHFTDRRRATEDRGPA